MLKPIEGPDTKSPDKTATYACLHWRNFPPPTALVPEPVRQLRAERKITDADVQRHEVWQRVCGLYRMDLSKCLGCEHVRKLVKQPHRVAQLVTLDGKDSTPAVDITTVASLGTNRVGRR